MPKALEHGPCVVDLPTCRGDFPARYVNFDDHLMMINDTKQVRLIFMIPMNDESLINHQSCVAYETIALVNSSVFHEDLDGLGFTQEKRFLTSFQWE